MGKLLIHVGDNVVFARYRPLPASGGYTGRVFPGGHFKGVPYDNLRALGFGEHEVDLDECADSQRGNEPIYESEWRRFFEVEFKMKLFMYGAGIIPAHEVLEAAREAIRLEN